MISMIWKIKVMNFLFSTSFWLPVSEFVQLILLMPNWLSIPFAFAHVSVVAFFAVSILRDATKMPNIPTMNKITKNKDKN